MASILQQVEGFFGVGGTTTGASAVSASSGTTGAAFSLQLSNNALLSGAEHVLIAAPNGATIDASGSSAPVVIVGNTGLDHLIGGSAADLIIGGPGTNVLTGNGGTDVFGHAAGATDYITDFSGSAGEKIAVAQGIAYSSVHTATVNPATVGLAGNPVTSDVLTFNDGSTVTLLGNTETPTANWFI